MNYPQIFLLTGCLVLSACATTPIGDQATPAENIVQSSLLSPSPHSGELVIRRDAGFLGGGCSHLVRIDGKLLGELSTGEQLVAYPSPGEHIVEVRTGGQLCNKGIGGAVAIQTVEGKRLTYRTGAEGLSVFIELVP